MKLIAFKKHFGYKNKAIKSYVKVYLSKGKTKADAMPVALQVKLRRCQSTQLARMIDWFTHADYDNSMHS